MKKSPSTFTLFFTIIIGSLLVTSCSLNSPKPCFELSCESLKQMDKILAGEEVLLINCTDNGIAYSWDFGDGSSSTLNGPRHSWETPGDYTITLIAENEDKEKSLSQDITISPSMYGNWEGTYNNGDGEVKVTFMMQQAANKITGAFNSDGVLSANSNISENAVTLNCVEYYTRREETRSIVYKFIGTVNEELNTIIGESVSREGKNLGSWQARKL